MKAFVGMETSGAIRRRLAAAGADAKSCDLLPAEDEGQGHLQGDVFAVLNSLRAGGWWPDVAVFHPDCTYLTVSANGAYSDGPYRLKYKPTTLVGAARREARERAIEHVRQLCALPIPLIVIENPIGALSKAVGAPTDIVQPYMFGDDASKATCIWVLISGVLQPRQEFLRRDPAKRFPGRVVKWGWRTVERWSNQTDSGSTNAPPSPDRWKDRARTYPGIADALTEALMNFNRSPAHGKV